MLSSNRKNQEKLDHSPDFLWFNFQMKLNTRFHSWQDYFYKGEMIYMNTKDFKAANLSENLVDEIQSLEEKLSQQANKKVVVIAYEQGLEGNL
ncbi:hypothetical protein UN64_10265 [Fictibacillus arsenicus]|uniref:Uncharacterized protein n=1 Tax=Fictibacillus arsenicus TaxID=255247 RepID=A0A1V3G7Q9_9BACL|nr:hypothetical protein UN64_10265 [Fictibacillus arsenicus]